MSAAQYPRNGVNISAGSTLANRGIVSLANTGGFHFGLQPLGASNVMTASAGISAAIQSISAGSTRITSGQAVFVNNGVQFGVDSNTLSAQAFQVGYLNNGRGGPLNGINVPNPSDSSIWFIQRVQFPNPMVATIGAIIGVNLASDPNIANQFYAIPLTWSITPGQYLIGLGTTGHTASIGLYTMTGSTASLQGSGSCLFTLMDDVGRTGGANLQGWAPNIQAIRAPGGTGDYTNYWADGTAIFASLPSSMHLSDVRQTTTGSGHQIPYFELAGDV